MQYNSWHTGAGISEQARRVLTGGGRGVGDGRAEQLPATGDGIKLQVHLCLALMHRFWFVAGFNSTLLKKSSSDDWVIALFFSS